MTKIAAIVALAFSCKPDRSTEARWKPLTISARDASSVWGIAIERGDDLRREEPSVKVLNATFDCPGDRPIRRVFDEKAERGIAVARYLMRGGGLPYTVDDSEYGQLGSRVIHPGETFENCRARVDVSEVTLAVKYHLRYVKNLEYVERPGGILEYRLLKLADGKWYFFDLLSPASAGCGGG